MPNVIKSNCVLITDDNVKVIDSNLKDEFSPMNFRRAVEIDEEENQPQEDESATEEELYQINHQKNASEKLHEMQAYAESLVEDAKKEAQQIKKDAILQAEQEIEQQKQIASQDGYHQGMQQAEQEINQKKQELAQQQQELEKEYDQKLVEMQSQISEIVNGLVQKITGVVIEDKSIITYLVCMAVKGQSACNEFRISVSKADYPILNEHLEEIQGLVRSTAQITIIENPELEKDQCKIETEKNILDAGIETKLENLKMALKLLT